MPTHGKKSLGERFFFSEVPGNSYLAWLFSGWDGEGVGHLPIPKY